MKAVAAANGGGVAGCSRFHRESLTPSALEKRNLVLPCTNYYVSSKRGSLRAVRQSPFSSAALQDRSHLSFYLNVLHVLRKDRLTNSVFRKAISGVDEVTDAERVCEKGVMKARKIEMKREKKLKKAARVAAGLSSSSSSSSSSESEAGETTKLRARTKRIDKGKLRRNWACISQSPLMDSIPTISSSFVIEQPRAARQLANSDGSSFAAQQAEATPPADVMAMRISSGVGSHTGVSSSAHVHRTLMSGAFVPLSPSAEAVHLEVCLGGKCKKAGAQEVLSAFQANGVNASACNKCMKKCKLAINVRVHQNGDDIPQMYSGIGFQDVNTLSRKHFGAGTASREQVHV